MARTGTPYEIVRDICDKLNKQKLRPSFGLVNAEIDGSPSKKTILDHIERWRTEMKSAAEIQGLSETIINSLKVEISEHVNAAKEDLEEELRELKESNRQALDVLQSTEDRNEKLEDEIRELNAHLVADQQDHERTVASLDTTVSALTQRVADLEKERDQLITSGEAVRTEAARAQLQLDQAVKAVSAAEKREAILDDRISLLTSERAESGKLEAVAIARVEELQSQNNKLSESLVEIKAENKELQTLLVESRKETNTLALAIKDADKRAALAEQRSDTQEEMIRELKSRLAEFQKTKSS